MRHEHVHEDALVAAAATVQDGHSPTIQDDDLAGLRPRRQLELLLAVEGRDRKCGAERGLRERQVDRREDIVAFADESLVGTDPNLDVDIPGAAARESGVALAAQTNPLAVVDSGRNVDRKRALLDHPPRTAALRARLLDPAARARARGARLGTDELTEDAARHLLQSSRAVARRAGRDLRSRFRTVSAAAGAGGGDLERNVARDTLRGFDEFYLDRCREIGAARAPAPAATAEQDVVSEEGREEIGEAAEVDVPRLKTAAAQAGMAVAVVEVARFRVRQHLVGLDDLLEPLLGIWSLGDVRMQLAGEVPERLFDLRVARRP